MAFYRDPNATPSNIAFWLADGVASSPEWSDVDDTYERGAEYERLFHVEHVPDDPTPLVEWFSLLPAVQSAQREVRQLGQGSVWLDGNTRLVRAYFRLRVVRPASGVSWSAEDDRSYALRSLWTGELVSYDSGKAITAEYELVELVWISSWRIARMDELLVSYQRWSMKLANESGSVAAFAVALRIYFGELLL